MLFCKYKPNSWEPVESAFLYLDRRDTKFSLMKITGILAYLVQYKLWTKA